MRAEYRHQRDDVARAASNARTIASKADVEEVLELVRIGWITDLVLFTDSCQLVVGNFGDGMAAVAYWGPEGMYYTTGDGPEGVSSFFQTDFPPNVGVSLNDVRAVVGGFFSRGERSNVVPWQQEPQAPPISESERDEFAAIFDSWPDAANKHHDRFARGRAPSS